jgi:hypothetical protein
MLELLQRSQQLLPSARYALLNSWLGALLHHRHRWPDPALTAMMTSSSWAVKGAVPPCLHSLDMIPPYEKVQLLLANGRLLDWCLAALKLATQTAEAQMRGKIPRARSMKESINHRDQSGVSTLACSRFLLSLLGMLTATFSGNNDKNYKRHFFIYFIPIL